MLFQGSAKGDDADLTVWPAQTLKSYNKLQNTREAAFMCFKNMLSANLTETLVPLTTELYNDSFDEEVTLTLCTRFREG